MEEIFNVLGFTPDQKKQAHRDLDTLIKAKVVAQLSAELPEEISSTLTPDTTSEILKDFYSPEVIDDRTEIVLKETLEEYLGYMLQTVDETRKRKIEEMF